MKYVAFLRAINVGGHVVKMDQLRSLFEQLKLSNVETFIASGNVIFDTKSTNIKSLESKIEKHLKKALGYDVHSFVRSIPELSLIATHKPFTDEELNTPTNTLFVAFVAAAPSMEVKKKIAMLASAIDDFHIDGREVYCLYR